MDRSLIISNIVTLVFLFNLFPSVSIKAMECDVSKKYVNMETIQCMCETIYEQAIEDHFEPDLIVGLSREGLVPMGFLAGERMFNNRNTRAIALTSYNDGGTQSGIKLLLPIHVEDLKEFKSILVIDDLADSGKSLEFVLKELGKNSEATIKTATLFYKKKSAIKPDYYVEETSDWIVFPWEK